MSIILLALVGLGLALVLRAQRRNLALEVSLMRVAVIPWFETTIEPSDGAAETSSAPSSAAAQ